MLADSRTKRFIAHRGANNAVPGNTLPHLPENTLPSMLEAYRVNASYVECDIHLSSDRQIIVLHDDTIRRTARFNPDLATTLTQTEYETILDANVSTLSYEQHLSQVDVGCYDDALDPKYRGTKIPLLSEFFDQLAGHPERHLFVELKAGDKAVINVLTDLVQSYHLNHDQLMFISFDFELIKSLKARLPDYKHLLLTTCSSQQNNIGWNPLTLFKAAMLYYRVNNEEDLRNLIPVVKEADLDGVHFQYHPTLDEYIHLLREQNLLSAVWTYAKDDTMEMVNKMLKAGTDLINTNQPEFVFGELEKSNELSLVRAAV